MIIIAEHCDPNFTCSMNRLKYKQRCTSFIAIDGGAAAEHKGTL